MSTWATGIAYPPAQRSLLSRPWLEGGDPAHLIERQRLFPLGDRTRGLGGRSAKAA